ncbi:MAG TPA: response regulator transcription factor [Terriglobales bacterium]
MAAEAARSGKVRTERKSPLTLTGLLMEDDSAQNPVVGEMAIYHSFLRLRLNKRPLNYHYCMPRRLLLAEDHEVARQGLRAILQQEELEVIAEAADGREAIKLCEERSPDVVVLGISEPLMNGMDAARQIVKRQLGTKVVLLIQTAAC